MDYLPVSTEAIQSFTADQVWHYRIIPGSIAQGKYELYIDERQDHRLEEIKNELEILTGRNIILAPTESRLIENSLNKFYQRQDTNGARSALEVKSEEFVSDLIREAKYKGSSDIHIESYEGKCRIRFRIDGKLVERYVLQKSEYPSLINKIKIMANLDIAEKRLPQDGRIFFTDSGSKIDLRVSVVPALFGEKIVMRLLGSDASEINISELGFNEIDLNNYLEGIKKPNGIILISGPTGSGKTTTLYATLKLLNKDSSNILTIEDPIEYTLEGINQVQLKENIGLTFSSALRSFLRQDPDIIMVGEIRDQDTANIAVRAALTGHLVLSTIHTNSAWGIVGRLIDMGIPSFLLASTLNVTVAQRLLRLLCPHCKEKEPFLNDLFPKNYNPPRRISDHYVAKGCNKCFHTGYKGRKAVYEVIPIDRELSGKIKNQDLNVDEELKKRNVKSLAGNAFELFENGETTIEEIYSLLFDVS